MTGTLKEHPDPKTPEERADFLQDYMPMKFGGPLISKLTKTNKAGQRYWEREESKGKPFTIAIADFHKPGNQDQLSSITYTQSALWQYLYGSRVTWHFKGDQLIINSHEIGEHKYNGKRVPSGFFLTFPMQRMFLP